MGVGGGGKNDMTYPSQRNNSTTPAHSHPFYIKGELYNMTIQDVTY